MTEPKSQTAKFLPNLGLPPSDSASPSRGGETEDRFGDSCGKLLPQDMALLLFVAFASVMVALFCPAEKGRTSLLITHALEAAGLLWMSRLDLSRWRVLRFVREALPLLLLFSFYREVETLNRLISPQFYDQYLLPVEDALFGGQPSIYLSERFPQVWFSELVHLVYFSYLLLIPGLTIPLYLLKRVRPFRETVFILVCTYYTCFVIFSLLPMESPNFLFPKITGELSVHPFFNLVHGTMQKGVTKGAAFPSSHVAMATAAAVCAYYYLPVLAPLYAVLAPGIGFATVYCRLHYGVDAVSGLLIGFALSLAAKRWLKARRKEERTCRDDRGDTTRS